MSESYRYLLGDSATETERLRMQAALWDPVSHALFDRLGVEKGWRVLEVGPGPGTLHFELRRRVQTPVDVVEPSAAFASALRERSEADAVGAGRIWNVPLHQADLPADTYDLIFARWVFLFLPDQAGHVRALARASKPGGVVAVQDYLRDTFCLVPRPDDWDALMAADRAFFASQGGDANVGTRLPALYAAAGLQPVDIVPTVKSGHPGSPVWNWLTTYFLGVLDQYAGLPGFSAAAAERIRRFWLEAERQPASLLIGPALLDVVGRKAFDPRDKR